MARAGIYFKTVCILAAVILCGGLSIMPAVAAVASVEKSGATGVYSAAGAAVYQIQVINLASNKKSSIGSGFQIDDRGLVATNYHVVAEAVQRADENRLEYLNDKGERGSLSLVDVDVVHDLALVRMDKPGPHSLRLLDDRRTPEKGDRLYALGNPHDIGFTIVEGTYNGFVRETLVEKIHFSGALNPGMSGGPALTADGLVAGINVATAGNQIGFLVPVKFLAALAATGHLPAEGLDKALLKRIETQLTDMQARNMKTLMESPWEKTVFGDMSVPGKMADAFRCWGAALHRDKDPFTYHRSTCTVEDRIYLDRDFNTGTYAYRYDLLSSRARDVPPARFYNFYTKQFAAPLDDRDEADTVSRDLTNYTCNTRFIKRGRLTWKAALCLRQYTKYTGLYDMRLYMARLGRLRDGFLVTLLADGVSRPSALALAEKFIDSLSPEKKTATPAVSKAGAP